MTKHLNKVNFDLDLSNKIYKANILSLIDLAKDNLNRIKERQTDFRISLREHKDGPINNDEFLETSSHFANLDWLVLNSIYIASLSYFEHHLYALARVLENRTLSKIKINDINGKGIFRFRKYLELVGELQEARHNKLWNDIELLQKARNIIVHNGGLIITDPTKSAELENHIVYKYLKQFDVPMSSSLGRIRIRNIKLLENFYNVSSILSDSLSMEVSKKYPIEDDSK